VLYQQPLSYFFFSSRRRHTISKRDWSSDVCSSDLISTFHSCTPCRSTPAANSSDARARPIAVRNPPYEPPHRPMPFGSTSPRLRDRKSTRLNSSHVSISYAVFCLKKKKKTTTQKYQ